MLGLGFIQVFLSVASAGFWLLKGDFVSLLALPIAISTAGMNFWNWLKNIRLDRLGAQLDREEKAIYHLLSLDPINTPVEKIEAALDAADHEAEITKRILDDFKPPST